MACQCPEGYTLLPDGVTCQKIETSLASLPEEPIDITLDIEVGVCGPGGLVVYENITSNQNGGTKQWPLFITPQNPPIPIPVLYPINANSVIPTTGPNWTSISPTPIGPNGEHDWINQPYPALWPPACLAGNPSVFPPGPGSTWNFRPIRESVVTSNVLYPGTGNVVNVTNCLDNAFWGGGTWTTATGVWTTPGTDEANFEWLGISVCFTLEEQKTLYIVGCVNNGLRFTVDGQLAVEMTEGDGATTAFYFVNAFPITLSAGQHVIYFEGYNYGGGGHLSFDILDIDLATLISPTLTLSALENYRIFGTIFRQPRTINVTSNGTTTITSTGDFLPTDGGGLLPAWPGTYIVSVTNANQAITNIPVPSASGNTQISFLYETGTNPLSSWQCPEGGTFGNCGSPQCIEYLETPCATYYVIRDCCCDTPYTVDGGVLVLSYTGVGYDPSLLTGLGITTIYNSSEEPVYSGCAYLDELATFPEEYVIVPYGDYVNAVQTVQSCDVCKSCIEGYKLQDCIGENDPIYTTTDLSQYIGQSITIAGYPDTCWLVIEDNNICVPTIEVVFEKDFPDCVICLTQYYKLTNCLDPEQPYIITAIDFSADVGNYIKLDDYPLICWLVEETDEYENAVPVTKAPGPDTYADCLTCLPKAYLLKDCQGIEPDLLVGTDLSLYVDKIVKIKYCDTCYQVSEIIPALSTFQVEIAESFDTCEECLPPILPPPPVELITRRVKPGYYTKGCPPEYTEKISCKFGETMFDDVARVRYGIDICCDHDVERWWIKKQILNLKAIYDPALDVPVKPTCYCYTITQGTGTNIFKYINCEGSCTNVTVSENTSINVCAMYSPKLVCPSDNDNFEIIKSNTECLSVNNCSTASPYVCVTISNPFKPEAEVAAFSIERGSVITFSISQGVTINLCTDPSTITVIAGDPVISVSTQSCLNDTDCPTIGCICYEVIAESTGALDYRNCEGVLLSMVVESTIRYVLCAQQNSIVSTAQISVTPLGQCDETSLCE
jgi:hypothetical protein